MIIQIIDQQAKATLVQWQDQDGLHRCYLPTELVTNDIPWAVLATGIPYGVDWEQYPVILNSDDLAKALRNRGVWTQDDLKNTANVKAAIQDALGIQIKTLIDFARQAQEVI